MEIQKKKTRDREANWESAETKFFRECVNMHLDVVESKLNDNVMVCKKRKAWEAIRAAMICAGYDREIPKLKSKWVSMKILHKKAVASMKQESDTTDSFVYGRESNEEDSELPKIIKKEFEVEEYTMADVNYAESSMSADYSEQDFSNNVHKSLTTSKQYLVKATRRNKRDSSTSSSPEHLVNEERSNKEDSCLSSKQKKKSRDREANWESAEIDIFRQCVQKHLDVVESKANDTSMVCKKRKAWEAIRAVMLSAGYDREIPKLKSKYASMKVMAKKAMSNVNQMSDTTDSSMHIPELVAEDNIRHKIIKEEFEEEYTVTDVNCTESPISTEYNEQDFQTNGHKPLSTPKQCLINAIQNNKSNSWSHNSPKRQLVDDNASNKECFLSSKPQHLQNLPKTASKNTVILERQRQILTESHNSEEIHKLQKKQLISEIEHMERMHKIKEIQEKELHALKLQQLQRQIDHDEELHALKLDILRKVASNEKPNLNL